MFKTLWDDTTWQRLINYISNYRSNLIQSWRIGVVIGSRSQDFFGISWSTSFTQSFAITLNSAKGVQKNSTVSQGNGLSGSRLLLISSISRTKIFTKLIRKRLWGNVWGQGSTSECAHHLITKMEKLPGTITVYNFFTNIVFLGFTYQVWHHIALLCKKSPYVQLNQTDTIYVLQYAAQPWPVSLESSRERTYGRSLCE